jgi:hypothetical protein
MNCAKLFFHKGPQPVIAGHVGTSERPSKGSILPIPQWKLIRKACIQQHNGLVNHPVGKLHCLEGSHCRALQLASASTVPDSFHHSKRCFVGKVSQTLFLTRDSPASLWDGSCCWFETIGMNVLRQKTSHLLLIRTNLDYGTILTAACACLGCSATDYCCCCCCCYSKTCQINIVQ